MRVRRQTTTGDYMFGHGLGDFHVNTAAGVAQRVMTRLKLFEGENWLDFNDGTPWQDQILGYGTTALYDAAIRDRVLKTTGVAGISNYASSKDSKTRKLTVSFSLQTIYGPEDVTSVLTVAR